MIVTPVIGFSLLSSRIQAETEFVPPRLDFGNAALVGIDRGTDSLRSYLPTELRSVADSITRAVEHANRLMRSFTKFNSEDDSLWHLLQYRLIQEDFVSKIYRWSDSTQSRVLSILGVGWGITQEGATLNDSAPLEAAYREYCGAAKGLIDAFVPILRYAPSVLSVTFKASSAPILNIYSDSLLRTIDFSVPIVVREELDHIYGTSAIPSECEDVLRSKRCVFIRYFEDAIHLAYAHYPLGANSYSTVVVLASPTGIRLPQN